MFVKDIAGTVTELSPNDQTRFQCILELTVSLDALKSIEPGTLVAADNVYASSKDKHYTIMVIVNSFPIPSEGKTQKNSITLQCTAIPIGIQLTETGKKKAEITAADTFPAFNASVSMLDSDTTQAVIHQIAPESRTEENGSRIDIGTYATNSDVRVGLDAASLLRGNVAIISARPRARTTITNDLITALLANTSQPVHIVYCDVNNQGTLSLFHLIQYLEGASILCLNDKFVPSSVYYALKNQTDRQAHKRAALDFLDMMILPSVLEQRRHDFVFAVSQVLRANRISIYRANELTVDQFINDIRIDILDGVDEDVSEHLTGLMNSIAETYTGERFTEQNTRDIIEMIEEFSQDSKSHSARRTMFDLRTEVQSIFESYSKDIPASARKTVNDIVTQLNDDAKSSLMVVQGQKTSDIMRFIGSLIQHLIDERLRRLKIRVPVLFIFNNVDEYVMTENGSFRESGRERFFDTLQSILAHGRRHGVGFCLTLESASSMDHDLASKIGTFFVGPITFNDEPHLVADLMNVSELLVRPAVNYEDGRYLFASSDSPYHRRVPLPVITEKNTDILHTYLDQVLVEQERRRSEYMAQEEERRKRYDDDRKRKELEQKRKAPQVSEPVHGEEKKSSSHDDVESSAESDTQAATDATSNQGRQRESRRQKAARKRAGGPQTQNPPGTQRSGHSTEPVLEEKSRDENSSLTFVMTRSGGYDIEDSEEATPEAPTPAVDEAQKAKPAKRTRRPRRVKKKEE